MKNTIEIVGVIFKDNGPQVRCDDIIDYIVNDKKKIMRAKFDRDCYMEVQLVVNDEILDAVDCYRPHTKKISRAYDNFKRSVKFIRFRSGGKK